MGALRVIRIPWMLSRGDVTLRPRIRSLFRVVSESGPRGRIPLCFQIHVRRWFRSIGCVPVFLETEGLHGADVGMAVQSSWMGRGYGAQALELLEGFLSGDVGVQLIRAHIRPENEAGLGLARSAGYECTRILDDGTLCLEKRLHRNS